MKLIKLSESHYIIVDDSEIKIGDYAIHNNKEYREKYNELPILCTESNCLSIQEHWNKVTHSTFLINESTQPDTEFYWNTIKEISLSEVEELIYGYSVEKMAEKECIGNQAKRGFNKGFQAAMELKKDKMFTVEDMRKMYNMSCGKIGLGELFDQTENNKRFDDFLKPILPKTEWEVEIINGKIKLI